MKNKPVIHLALLEENKVMKVMSLYIAILKNSIKGLSGKLAKILVLGIRFFKISNALLNHMGFICIGSLKAKQLYFALQKESKERKME